MNNDVNLLLCLEFIYQNCCRWKRKKENFDMREHNKISCQLLSEYIWIAIKPFVAILTSNYWFLHTTYCTHQTGSILLKSNSHYTVDWLLFAIFLFSLLIVTEVTHKFKTIVNISQRYTLQYWLSPNANKSKDYTIAKFCWRKNFQIYSTSYCLEPSWMFSTCLR